VAILRTNLFQSVELSNLLLKKKWIFVDVAIQEVNRKFFMKLCLILTLMRSNLMYDVHMKTICPLMTPGGYQFH
jgi:hypothetical protein